jgi:hypothetical protein
MEALKRSLARSLVESNGLACQNDQPRERESLAQALLKDLPIGF